MISKAQQLLDHLGGNMAESLGQRKRAEAPPLAATDKKYDGRTRSRNAGEMRLENIIPDPNQPRKEFDPAELERLAQSLRDHGQLQAIRVRWSEADGKWIILAGERRYRAALQAGLPTIACIFVEDALSDVEILEEQLVENCLRADLKPIEQANSFAALMRHHQWSGKELAEHLHLDPSSVTRALALLTLPEDVQEQVTSGALAPSVAYEVAKLDHAEDQRAVTEEVIAGQLNRAQTVAAVNARRGRTERKPLPRSCTLTYKTKRRWTVVLTVPKQKVGDDEVLAELEELVRQLRAKAGKPSEAA